MEKVILAALFVSGYIIAIPLKVDSLIYFLWQSTGNLKKIKGSDEVLHHIIYTYIIIVHHKLFSIILLICVHIIHQLSSATSFTN
jgi:hypothetical protein